MNKQNIKALPIELAKNIKLKILEDLKPSPLNKVIPKKMFKIWEILLEKENKNVLLNQSLCEFLR
ncbi:hypothetical protein JFL47_03425 [Haemophilus haemoglobinophilus]|nr:hypothetical protein [Canicola haemoglobinophilus]